MQNTENTIKFSPNFTLEELIKTSQSVYTAQNIAYGAKYMPELKLLANYILEPTRAVLKTPLIITSGLRCAGLNAALGGAKNSQHLYGQAADFVPLGIDIRQAFAIIKNSGLISYGQLILEDGWLHISLGVPYRPLQNCLQAFEK